MRSSASLAFLGFWACGCVEVTDLRQTEAVPDVPVGQIDTGWIPDASGPDLPDPISCTTEAGCVEWLSGVPCQLGQCIDGQCGAVPLENGLPCSDGDPATRGDECIGGRCEPGASVCICGTDLDCEAFDDGNACNGRLACDGCGCTPVATPVGAPCDDFDPTTVDDSCTSDTECAGVSPCFCLTSDDCAAVACTVSVCSDCSCRSFPDSPGAAYLISSAADGIPAGWTTTATNPLVAWRAGVLGGLRATGADGSYDHGSADSSLVSPAVALPAGAALLVVRIGLLSGEDGCDDRLEVRFGELLLDTLCGPQAPAAHSYGLPGGEAGAISLRFVSDDADNAGAGAVFEEARLVRVAPSTCGATGVEVALSVGAGRAEKRPDIALTSPTSWLAVWDDEDGVHARAVDADGQPTGVVVGVDALGREPALAREWVAWERGSDVVVAGISSVLAGGGLEKVLLGARAPDLDGVLPAIAVTRIEDGSSELRDLDDVVVLSVADVLWPARAAELQGAAWLVVATPEGISARRSGEQTELSTAVATGRPDAATGLNRIGVVWPDADGLTVATSAGESIGIQVAQPAAAAITATASSWVVVWEDAGALRGALLTGTLTQTLPLASIETWSDGAQTAPRLAPAGERAMAVWETPWLDGDAATVAVRRLPHPLLDL